MARDWVNVSQLAAEKQSALELPGREAVERRPSLPLLRVTHATSLR